MADVAALRTAHEAGLANAERREVVVVDVALGVLEGQVVDPLLLLHRAERHQSQRLRLPAGEDRRAVRARHGAGADGDRADLVLAATVGAPLVNGDLGADDLLVDAVDGGLDGTRRRSVQTVLRPRGERQLDLVDDALDQRRALGALELLGVLLSVGQALDGLAELLLHRCLDGGGAAAIADEAKCELDLRAPDHDLFGRVGRDGRALSSERCGLGLLDAADAVRGDLAVERGAVLGVQLGVNGLGVPLGLAGLLLELHLRGADVLDDGVGQLERLDHLVLGHDVGAGLDHGDGLGGAAHDQVEIALEHVGHGGVDAQLAVDQTDAHSADRAGERQRGDHQRRGGAVHRENVMRDDHVDAQHGPDDLDFVAEALREQRADRTIDHARIQGGLLGGLALALEEAARNLAGGVHLLFNVDGQREEVRAGAGLLRSDDGGQDDGVGAGDQHRAVCLLRQLPGRKAETDVSCCDLNGDFSAKDVTHSGYFPSSAASGHASRVPPFFLGRP